MRPYLTRIRAFTAILIIYTLIASVPGLVKYQELFPFFDWNLFSYSGSQLHDVTIEFSSLNGERLDEPLLVGSLYDRLPWLRRNVNFNKALLHLAKALDEGDAEDAERLRSFVEERYLGSIGSAQYELVLIRYAPLERFRDPSKFTIVRRLGSFRYGE